MTIEGSKQQQLTFEKGITNVPSDAICSDNSLSESVGMVYDNGEHRVIQKPELFINTGSYDGTTSAAPTILLVHKFNGEERFIGVHSAIFVWGIKSGTQFVQKGNLENNGATLAYTGNEKLTTIGKTLIISNGEDFAYFLWKNDKYEGLGNKIPAPDVEFAMIYGNWGTHNTSALNVSNSQDAEGCLGFTQIGVTDYFQPDVAEGKQDLYNNIVVGLYAKCLKAVAERKCFAKPFLVRYAIELYDGSYTCQSAPIAMFPAVTKNCLASFSDDQITIEVGACLIAFKADFDYSQWSDLVKGVVVFVSDGVALYDTTNNQTPQNGYEGYAEITGGVSYHDSIQASGRLSDFTEHSSEFVNATVSTRVPSVPEFLPLNSRGTNEILDDLKTTSVFYKLFEIGIKASNTWQNSRAYIKSHVIENLTTQEQLPDDYYSHTSIGGMNIFSYNNRLLVSNVHRSFFDGFNSFLPYDNDNSYSYHVYVYINTPSGERIVCKTIETYEKLGIYFFYPDPRAYKADVYLSDGSFVLSMDLKEHPFLNGAYFFGSLPDGSEGEPTETSGEDEPTPITTSEILNNQIWTSEVNNPFIFKAEGNITVGNGNIIGISTLTQALSQGQFGQYPLIIFGDEGIWAASTGDTGLFTAIHPMSREVCNNPKSITQTDGAIFFSSAKGLMVILGSTVKCVSEQMAGKNDALAAALSPTSALGSFSVFLKNCFIAYDYRDSLLWIFNGTSTSCYVYSIKSGTFAKYSFTNAITNIVNYYPDFLLQDSDNNIYTLTGRHDINSDEEQTNSYSATLLTRPMKLENALALKKLIQMAHIKDMEGSLTIRLFASNTLKQDISHWAELNSLLGTPWKYYRFLYSFTGLKATDRFAGTVLVTKEERTNKLR